MSDPEIVMSPLCREITGDGTKIQVDIYRGEDDPGWILEVVDEENASTVWDPAPRIGVSCGVAYYRLSQKLAHSSAYNSTAHCVT